MDSSPLRVPRVRESSVTVSSSSVAGRRVNFPVLCCHRILAKYAVVQTHGENYGRRYYGCPLHPADGHCKFFVWEEELLAYAKTYDDHSTADSASSSDNTAAAKIARLKAKNCLMKEESLKEKNRTQQQASRAKIAYLALLISWVLFAVSQKMS